MPFLLAQFGSILVSYFVLSAAVPWFFEVPRPPLGKKSLMSVCIIVLWIALVSVIVYFVPSVFWANRIQHAFGGGFLELFICFRAFKDTGVAISPIRFFLLAGMLVTTLGVANEIMELFFQVTIHFIFADSIYDTWLDLLSNTVGATLGGLVFAPFISRKQ